MEKDVEILREYLNKRDIASATRHILSLADQKPIYEVYEQVIGKLLSEVGLPDSNEKFDIVNEHIYSNIIKTIIENCIYEVERQSKPRNGKSVLVCTLEEEYHEIGIRMINDYFKLAGFDTIYLGCNIPNEDIMKAIMQNDVDCVAVSVTNFYHLSKLKKLITQIRKFTSVNVYVGGQAIQANSNLDLESDRNVKIITSSQMIFNLEVQNEADF